MPALIDDPASAPVFRQSGAPPFNSKDSPLPSGIAPFEVQLRDGSVATVVPFSSLSQAPSKLVTCLGELLNREIEAGDTYPMLDPMPLEKFGPYWFANVAILAFRGNMNTVEAMLQPAVDAVEWDRVLLGTFYIKPNYPGRSSHICNAGFLVHESARGQGIGRILAKAYIEWAPKLGYVYSVFNLVYASNTASCRLWDSLGFDRIGRVPGCGNLKGHEGLVDAIQYGRHLVPKEEAERRFAGLRLQSQDNAGKETEKPATKHADNTVSGASGATEVNPSVLL